MIQEHSEPIRRKVGIEPPGASEARSSARRRFGPVVYVVAASLAIVIIPSLFFDGGLAALTGGLGFGLGAGLVPMMLVGIPISVGFLVLAAVTPARDELQGRARERTGGIRLEDLPPLLGMGSARRTRAE
jgi:hypothetical protein